MILILQLLDKQLNRETLVRILVERSKKEEYETIYFKI